MTFSCVLKNGSPPHGTVPKLFTATWYNRPISLLNGVRVKTRSDSQGNLVSASILCVSRVCGENCP